MNPNETDRSHMIHIITTLLVVMMLPIAASAEDFVLDSNTAFFEGEVYNYIVPAPRGFRMVTEPALADGFSLAFIPENEPYDKASITIAVSYLKLAGGTLDDVIAADTSAAREYFGEGMISWPVDSLRCFNGQTLRSYFFDNTTEFLPLVMMSYFNGRTDMVVFELYIEEDKLPRFQATELYTKCISLFRALKKATVEP